MKTARHRRAICDAELLTRDFRVTDPLNSVQNLSRARPDPDLSPHIVGFYEEAPSGGRAFNFDKPFIWCCHCQKSTHWKGYVVEDATELRFTIGNDCGRDHYGAAFDLVVKSFNEERARKGVIRSFLRLATRIESLGEEINMLLACPHLATHEAKSREMFKAAPKAFGALKRAVERGSLTAVRKTRNREAEALRDERYQRALAHFQARPSEERRELRDAGLKPEPDDRPIIETEHVNFGVVSGTSLLGFDDPRRDGLAVVSALRSFEAIQRKGTDSFSVKEIAAARRNLMDATDRLWHSLIGVSFGQKFFDRANLERISSWSECFRGFDFYTDGTDLFVSDGGAPAARICPIATGDIATVATVNILHYTRIEDDLLCAGDAVLADPDDPASTPEKDHTDRYNL